MIYIKRIDEPDFGCEGVPDNEVICDKIVFAADDGREEVLNIPETVVWDMKIDEGMYITDELYNKLKEKVYG